MSTIGITTDLISQVSYLPSAANEFVTDLNRLAHDLQSGDLAAAQQDYVLFSEASLDTGESVQTPASDLGVTTSFSSSTDSATATGPSASGDKPVEPEPAPVEPAGHTGQGQAPTPAASPSVSAGPAPSLSLRA